MWRRVAWAWAAVLIPTSAGADTAPSGKKYVPRQVQILGLDQAGDDFLVMHHCHPLRMPSDFRPNYCVLTSPGPFRVNGRPYFVPKQQFHFEAVDAGKVPEDQPIPFRIKELSRYGDDTSDFFQKSPLVRVGRLEAHDALLIPSSSGIQRVLDVWRVVKGEKGPAKVEAEKVVFVCSTGEKIEQPALSNPWIEPLTIPVCSDDRRPPSAPRPEASATPAPPVETEGRPSSRTAFALALGLGLVAIGTVAALLQRKRT